MLVYSCMYLCIVCMCVNLILVFVCQFSLFCFYTLEIDFHRMGNAAMLLPRSQSPLLLFMEICKCAEGMHLERIGPRNAGRRARIPDDFSCIFPAEFLRYAEG